MITKIINGRKAILIDISEKREAFYIDQIPVTIGAYQKCVSTGKCSAAHYRNEFEKYVSNPLYSSLPVTFITWEQARQYCAANGGDLPTARQWEAAAGDGIYAWGDDRPTAAKANIDGWYQTQLPAGWLPKGSSPYGVLDMTGNVREWVLDEDEYGNKGLKGGSYQDSWSSVRNENTYYHEPNSSGFNRGFRCTFSYTEEDQQQKR